MLRMYLWRHTNQVMNEWMNEDVHYGCALFEKQMFFCLLYSFQRLMFIDLKCLHHHHHHHYHHHNHHYHDDDDDDDDDDENRCWWCSIMFFNGVWMQNCSYQLRYFQMFIITNWCFCAAPSGWSDGGMKGWRDGGMEGWRDEWTDEQIMVRLGHWVAGSVDEWMDGWVGGWVGGWMRQWMPGWVRWWMDGRMHPWSISRASRDRHNEKLFLIG